MRRVYIPKILELYYKTYISLFTCYSFTLVLSQNQIILGLHKVPLFYKESFNLEHSITYKLILKKYIKNSLYIFNLNDNT